MSKPGLKTCAKTPQIVKENAGRVQNDISCIAPKPSLVGPEDANAVALTLSAELFLNLSNYC